MGDFSAQDVASAACSFAKVGYVDEQMFTTLARVAVWRVCNFDAQDLTNTAWALATTCRSDAQMLT